MRSYLQVVLSSVLILLLQACHEGGNSSDVPRAKVGEVQVRFGNLKSMSVPVTGVVVTVQPAGVSSLLPALSTGEFEGTMVLPLGLQTFTATAYGNGVSIASGSAAATIVAHGIVLVVIQMQDVFLRPDVPDRGPIILSVVVSNVAPQIGEPVTMTVSAADVDGDPLTYGWSTDCVDEPFTDPASAVTQWSSSIAQVCEISIEVSSRLLSDTAGFSLIVYSGSGLEGGASLSGSYFPAPEITSLYFKNASGATLCTVNRSDPDASCRVAVAPGSQVQFRIAVDYHTNLGTRSHSLVDSCDGEPDYDKTTTGSGNVRYLYYFWTAPLQPTVCAVTPSVINSSVADALPIAVLVK